MAEIERLPSSFVDLRKARSRDQLEVMQGIQDRQECPFCPENLSKTHKQEILLKGAHWLLTRNNWPYENTQLHLLAIAAYHAETIADLREGAFDELQGQVTWAERELDIRSGGLCIRFGDISQNGATVNHLHAHIIVPVEHDDETEVDKKVRFKIW
jgi:diadenosine tetraphosphate (Ap4A) HIT family hydrolase